MLSCFRESGPSNLVLETKADRRETHQASAGTTNPRNGGCRTPRGCNSAPNQQEIRKQWTQDGSRFPIRLDRRSGPNRANRRTIRFRSRNVRRHPIERRSEFNSTPGLNTRRWSRLARGRNRGHRQGGGAGSRALEVASWRFRGRRGASCSPGRRHHTGIEHPFC